MSQAGDIPAVFTPEGESLEHGGTGAEWLRQPSGSTLPSRRRWNRPLTGMPLETHPRRTGFARSYAMQSMPLPRTRAHGSVMEAVHEGTSSRDFPSPWYYRLRGDEVEVIAMAHGRRRPGYWRSRL